MNRPNQESMPEVTQDTETARRKALYDAASSLAASTHLDSLRDFAIALRDSVELPDEFQARKKAEWDYQQKINEQTR